MTLWMLSLSMVIHLGLGSFSQLARAGETVDVDQTVPLTRTDRDCLGFILPPIYTNPVGFATINKTASGSLMANIVVQKGTPNTIYQVRLIQTPTGADCGIFDGTLTTDDDGNGEAEICKTLTPGTSGAFVALNNNLNYANDYMTTREVCF